MWRNQGKFLRDNHRHPHANLLLLQKEYTMETLQTLTQHRSIRKFKPDPVDPEILHTILHAGGRASTTGNMQLYSIIVTREPKRKEELCGYHFKQKMVVEAPVILTFCADFNRFNTWCRLRKAEPGYDNFLSFTTAAIDALLAAQNVTIAAEDLGLGVCYLGTTTYMAHKLVDFFSLPKGVVPITTLVIGYPDEATGLTDRLPLTGFVHKETYLPYTEDKINDIYREKESLPLTAALLVENQLETLAQIFTQKRYTRKDNELFSRLFLEVIEKQGFMNNGEPS